MIECIFFSFMVRGEGKEGERAAGRPTVSHLCRNDHAGDSLYSYNVMFSKKIKILWIFLLCSPIYVSAPYHKSLLLLPFFQIQNTEAFLAGIDRSACYPIYLSISLKSI